MTVKEFMERLKMLDAEGYRAADGTSVSDGIGNAAEIWSNNACIGYCIIAMENAGFNQKQIQAVVEKFNEAFDWTTLEEAERKCIEFPERTETIGTKTLDLDMRRAEQIDSCIRRMTHMSDWERDSLIGQFSSDELRYAYRRSEDLGAKIVKHLAAVKLLEQGCELPDEGENIVRARKPGHSV